jgi:predicted lipoprotein with Yx(FWY)xxD motif
MPPRLDGHVDSSGDCADIRLHLGVYVFGAITPADRAIVVRHLDGCLHCRDELAGLAGLPGLLLRPPAVAAAFAASAVSASAAAFAVAPGPDHPPALLDRALGTITRGRHRRRRLAALAATGLTAAAVAGWATYLAVPPAPGPSGTVLETETVGGVTVLTNAAGFTLYWFAPDTATWSACDARCAQSWPPVTGPVTAGQGVTGAMGTITRPGGSVQATYDGHPLYTASVDTAPGQAKGNGLNAGGGLWYEMTVSGAAPPVPSPHAGQSEPY